MYQNKCSRGAVRSNRTQFIHLILMWTKYGQGSACKMPEQLILLQPASIANHPQSNSGLPIS